MRSICIVVLSLLMAFPAGLMAQEPQTAPVQPEVQAAPDSSGELDVQIPKKQVEVHSFARQVFTDDKNLWLSPLRIQNRDAKWLLPLAGATAFLFATDHGISNAARSNDGLLQPSHAVSNLGSFYVLASATGAFYGIGKLTHNEKTADMGRMAGEALIQTEIVVQGLKFLTGRTRPNGGAHSFPSGHTASTFAFATIVAEQYHDNPLIGIGAYGAATAVGLSRIGGLNHYPSDVLVGAAIGTLIGRFVYNRSHENDHSLSH